MIFIWLLVGTLMVSVPFYIFYNPYDLWPPIIAGGIGAAVYLLALAVKVIRSERSSKLKMIVATSTLVILALNYIGWSSMNDMSTYQRSTLAKIRTVIAEGIFIGDDVNTRAMPVFVQYHKTMGKKKGIVTIFKNIHGNKMKGDMFLSEDSQNDASKRYVHFYGDTMVVLTSIDTIARGLKSEFANANGSSGRVQTTTTITAKGVTYERNN